MEFAIPDQQNTRNVQKTVLNPTKTSSEIEWFLKTGPFEYWTSVVFRSAFI
jgi:hypothetical protein